MSKIIYNQQFSNFLKSIHDCAIVINEKGAIKVVNPAVKSIFGYLQDELVGQNISMLISEKYRKDYENYLKFFFRKEEKGPELSVSWIDKNEKNVDVQLNIFPVDDKDETEALLVFKPSIERDYDKEIKALTEANKGLEKYSYKVTHNLKSPLAKVQSLVSILLDKVKKGEKDGEVDTITNYIKSSIESMDTTIRETLKKSKGNA